MAQERDLLELDVVFVGAGPASLAGAIRLAQLYAQHNAEVKAGTTTGPDGTAWQWIGERAPSLKRKGAPRWGKPTQLFNGRDLGGWTPSDLGSAASWKVENGTLVSPGRGPELITDAKFEDFKLHVEFNCAPGSNSGVYLRGR